MPQSYNELPWKTQPFKTVGEENISWRDDSIILFTDEEIFTVVTPQYLQNDRLYVIAATKKKNVSTKRLRVILVWSKL